MSPVAQIIVLTTNAGLAMAIGAILASVERIHARWLEEEFRHTVIAFGGGVLLAAVALVLVPEGVRGLPIYWAIPAFLLGGLAFLLLDRMLLARATTSSAQMIAMLADFVPEALALGAACAAEGTTGLLLAMLIALQKVPEGFNSYRELIAGGRIRGGAVVSSLLLLAPVGPAAGLLGYYWLSGFPEAVSFIMLAAAGGILYLTFQDIAPQARLRNAHAPAFGAVLGFVLGLAGHILLSNAGS